ncbi:MAG: hypothetical protein QM727_07890 [Niabella sp.]
MKWLRFKKIIFLFSAFSARFSGFVWAQNNAPDTVYLSDTVYVESGPRRYRPQKPRDVRWQRLIPKYYKVQYAGSMGLISLGTGWDYGRNGRWETDMFLGFVPKFSTERTKFTFTLKQNFIPWAMRISEDIRLKPFSTGLYLNTMFGRDFWGTQPSKYPSKYYNFSPKMRINIFAGQGWEYTLRPNQQNLCKSVTFFYEVSTN